MGQEEATLCEIKLQRKFPFLFTSLLIKQLNGIHEYFQIVDEINCRVTGHVSFTYNYTQMVKMKGRRRGIMGQYFCLAKQVGKKRKTFYSYLLLTHNIKGKRLL